ncbi:UNVERIFIED_CONTAM: hypothetical protein HDU68_012827 [Siphonaria sp. JEL0065]|nr:hypothetical protein HDU68_012827 [Siphonaria sp. JEL0065]
MSSATPDLAPPPSPTLAAATTHMPTADSALTAPLSDVAPPSTVETKDRAPGKRPQVKNACGNCKKSCKKCENVRPCPRCVQRGIADTCQDSERKTRPMGMQRGPYRRRACTANGKPESLNISYSSQNQNKQLQYQQQLQNANVEYSQQTYNPVIPQYISVLVPQHQQFSHPPPHLSPACLQPSQYSTNPFIATTPLSSQQYHVYNLSPLPASVGTSPIIKQYEQPVAQMTPLSALSILSDLALESDKSRLKELESTIGFDVSQFSPARDANIPSTGTTSPACAPPRLMSSSLGFEGGKPSKPQETTPLQTPDRSG